MKSQHRSFRRRSWRKWAIVAALVTLLLARLAWDRWWVDSTPSVDKPLSEGIYSVLRVVDGPGLIVRDHAGRVTPVEGVRVRLLGIDCLETAESAGGGAESWGLEASEFTRRFAAGHRVRLQFDKRRVERDGSYLAYVFVDGQMLNEALVRAGLACVATYPGDSLSVARRLRAAEQDAIDQERGIWSKE